MSGHFFFGERWYGFDDGIYAAARLLEILASDPEGRDAAGRSSTRCPRACRRRSSRSRCAKASTTASSRISAQRATFEGARITTIDGVRADWPDGWGLVRASNTTPVLVLRFDADNAAALQAHPGRVPRAVAGARSVAAAAVLERR